MRTIAAILLSLLIAACATSSGPVHESPYNLGVAAYRGKQYSEAAAQWTLAADAGNTKAMNNLAFLLYNGRGVEKDLPRAVQLWTVAAQAGESESQSHLAGAFESGTVVPRDLVVAYAWYRCAIHNAESNLDGHWSDTENEIADDARRYLIGVSDQLSAAELAQARTLAAEYMGKYGRRLP